ncbi:hypothetical protein FIBSPDRAFT_931536 [Athelia psychrophila]|uniref:Uncharacterized protein n=1 Tax=Athelia psychrophila TaxID=1759441 RepID=A0A166KC59_9AGAM|nr:hypothetical protein FIBSPDRAFT_931536 [Fibularhizoctonia sp. CBS 109695]
MTLYWLHRLTFPAATRPTNRGEGMRRYAGKWIHILYEDFIKKKIPAGKSSMGGGNMGGHRKHHWSGLSGGWKRMIRYVCRAAGIMACTAAVFCAQRDARTARSSGERDDEE